MNAPDLDTPEIASAVAEWSDKHYTDYVVQVAEQIRSLADEFTLAARPRRDEGALGVPRYTAAAEQALHRILWGLANLNADDLIGRAALADKAEREVSLAGEAPGSYQPARDGEPGAPSQEVDRG